MFEIADRLLAALDRGTALAVATAVSIDGSAPRAVGTSMAFDGESVIGSIAGGCVEGAVVEVCELVLADGVARTVEFGVSDDTAFSVGLTCGGRLRIHIRRMVATDAAADALRTASTDDAAGIVSVLGAGATELATRHARRLDAELAAHVTASTSGLVTLDCEGESVEAFIEVSAPAPRMVILGAMEFSAALAAAARVLGYRVTVCDPRPLFATPARFPGVEIVVAWPPEFLREIELDARSVVCVLSHDARFDAEAIAIALASPAGFVGAMGSRGTHDRRVASLRERGVGDEALARLKSPIGLDLGSSTPAETAVSILAEVIAARSAATARSLSMTTGPIHRTIGVFA